MPINYAVLNGIAQHLGWDERMPEITKENFYNLGQTLNQDDTNAFLGCSLKFLNSLFILLNIMQTIILFSRF